MRANSHNGSSPWTFTLIYSYFKLSGARGLFGSLWGYRGLWRTVVRDVIAIYGDQAQESGIPSVFTMIEAQGR